MKFEQGILAVSVSHGNITLLARVTMCMKFLTHRIFRITVNLQAFGSQSWVLHRTKYNIFEANYRLFVAYNVDDLVTFLEQFNVIKQLA